MALPNLLTATTIFGRTAYANVTTVSSNVLVNTDSSGNSYRIVNLTVANRDLGNVSNITVTVNRAGISNYLAVGIVVPSKSSLIVLGKDNSLILEEGDALQISSDANNRIWGTVVYEDIR